MSATETRRQPPTEELIFAVQSSNDVLTLTIDLCYKHYAAFICHLTYSHELAIGSTTPEDIVHQGYHIQSMTLASETTHTQTETEASEFVTFTNLCVNYLQTNPRLVKFNKELHPQETCHLERLYSVLNDTENNCSAYSPVCRSTLQLIGLTDHQIQELRSQNVLLPSINFDATTGSITFRVNPILAMTQDPPDL